MGIRVFVSVAQLAGTMHNICKVQGSNFNHHKKTMQYQSSNIKSYH